MQQKPACHLMQYLIDTHGVFTTLCAMSEGKSAGQELVISVLKPSVAEIAADAAEIILDSQLEDGLIKDIPIVGWLVKSYGVVNNIRDKLFLKKILLFLETAGNTNESERAEFEENCKDPEFRKHVGETLLLHLDKHDSFDKSKILGLAFARFVAGKIDYGQFLSLAEAIDRIPVDYLEQFTFHWDWNLANLDEPQALLYALSGLVKTNYRGENPLLRADGTVIVRLTYEKTVLGEHMTAIMKEFMPEGRPELLATEFLKTPKL